MDTVFPALILTGLIGATIVAVFQFITRPPLLECNNCRHDHADHRQRFGDPADCKRCRCQAYSR